MVHHGPSVISIDTIYFSHGHIPDIFLRGAGVPDPMIDYMHSLVESMNPIDYYSCFISYSSKDENFANRLYADLQARGVRCWFASLASTWVGYEVEKALDKEPEGKPNVLFPIRLDKAILTCETDWAKDIRKSRHIGDFEHWKDHDAYRIAFERLLRDLKAQS